MAKMLIHSSKIIRTPVLSLHVGGKIAETVEPIIDPDNLQIMGFTLSGPIVGRDGVGDILDVRYVREFSRLGMIVDSHDDFTTREDAIRIGKVMELEFTLIGKKVVTRKGTRLGKVVDYTLSPEDFQIRQLIVQRPPLKALMDPELVISTRQITKVSNTEIVVRDEEEKIREELAKEEFIPNFVNPFREQRFVPAQNQNPDEQDKQ